MSIQVITNFSLIAEQYHHTEFEIGLSNELVCSFTEKLATFRHHIHVEKIIGHSERFGLRYDMVSDDHRYTTISFIPMYRLIDYLSIRLSPEVTLKLSEQL
ncbi:MAG: hypothetical protein A2W99_15445 [Bacteroidetes bacterium GWF2_33_16]|nr:MAG: hypothetical protein A2X00_09655 [Bacteroidetes bacterium GWE2_32_14]OFY07714.1 MAG: hypothetical protein A2W99_15445 [Bacteroidetes bacterium GWF2_33_16]